MREIDPNKCIDFILENAGKYAAAKGELAQLETFKSSLKAIMMQKSGEQTIGAQEREAYADPEYHTLLKGLAAAIAQEETLRWEIEAARLDIEIFRTREATNRMQDRAHQWSVQNAEHGQSSRKREYPQATPAEGG